MSLLSNRQVQLSLRSDGLHASAWRGRWRATQMAACDVALDTRRADADTDARALRDLFDRLALEGAIGGSTLHVELADSMVHFDVVAGEFAGLGPRTLSNVADACVAELLGEQAVAHAVRWQLQRDERHLLVCALPRHWLEASAAVAIAHRLRVGHMRPRFSAQWNHHFAGRQVGDTVFALADGPHALIACIRDGAITAISSGPWFADSGAFSDSTVDRLLAGMGLAGRGDVALIDLQVGRLMAGMGIDPAAPTAHVLVCAGEPPVYLSHHWEVRRPWGDPA